MYLRATEYRTRPGQAFLDSNVIAENLYRKALDLDPVRAGPRATFPRPRGALLVQRDHTLSRMALAKEEAERALALQPDLAEAHAALGFVHYWGARDYRRAVEESEIARKRVPESVEYIGYVQRRQGRFEEPIRSLDEAARLDPVSPRVLGEQANTMVLLRRYADAERLIDRLLVLAPDLLAPRVSKAYLQLIALREGRWAAELLPASKDAVLGPIVLEQLAGIEARVGETGAALDHLELLLRIPSAVSVSLLRVDPAWAPLRGHPGFQKLVAQSRL